MSELRRCDHCGRESLASQGVSWARLERWQVGLASLSFEEQPGPWDFCSWQCLERFAAAQQAALEPPSVRDTRAVLGTTADGGPLPGLVLSQEHFDQLASDSALAHRDPKTGRPWWQKLR